MDALLDCTELSNWILQYGSIALFILLMLGIIALPVSEETLMVIERYLDASWQIIDSLDYRGIVFGSNLKSASIFSLKKTSNKWRKTKFL